MPKYWQKLRDLQYRNERPFKKEYSIFDLEQRFKNGYIPKKRKAPGIDVGTLSIAKTSCDDKQED